MSGLNPYPMQAYSLIERFWCAKCQRPPDHITAEGRSPIAVVIKCHGQVYQGSHAFSDNKDQKSWAYTQVIFEE